MLSVERARRPHDQAQAGFLSYQFLLDVCLPSADYLSAPPGQFRSVERVALMAERPSPLVDTRPLSPSPLLRREGVG